MSKELSRDEFVARLKTRENGKYSYLYQVGVLATANEKYVYYAYDHILKDETEEIGNGKLQLKGIKTIQRKSSYKYAHAKTAQNESNRGEELFVLDIFENKDKDYVKAVFGDLIDYQVPLKNKRTDNGAGKIDFIFEKDGALYLAEVKANYSTESALKAIVEVQTYYQIVDKEKLLSDFGKAPNTPIKKVVVLFNNTKGAKQIKENSCVKDLLKKFDIETITLVGKVEFSKLS